MKELIDKSTIVAEIEKRKKDWKYGNSTEAKYKREECDDILSFLDTLEVKEIGVDLGDPNGDKGVNFIVDTKTLEVKEVDSLTDALIEKAWSWVEDNILSSNQQDKSLLYYERLKNYIKE